MVRGLWSAVAKKPRQNRPNRERKQTSQVLPPVPAEAVLAPPPEVRTPTLAEIAGSWIGNIFKWMVTPVGIIGFIATLFGLRDLIQQSNPMVQIPQFSPVDDQLPFTVTNPSHVFSMYSVTPKCDASSEIYFSNDIHLFTAVIHGTSFDVPATEARHFPCSLPIVTGNSSLLDDISKIVWGGVTVSFSYRTFLWPFERRTSDVSFVWKKSPAGQRLWVPVDNEVVLQEKRAAAKKYGNSIKLGPEP
jgi:hypothetical protein